MDAVVVDGPAIDLIRVGADVVRTSSEKGRSFMLVDRTVRTFWRPQLAIRTGRGSASALTAQSGLALDVVAGKTEMNRRGWRPLAAASTALPDSDGVNHR